MNVKNKKILKKMHFLFNNKLAERKLYSLVFINKSLISFYFFLPDIFHFIRGFR